MKEIEKTNPELMALYREHAYYLKTGKKISGTIQTKIDELERRPVILSTITQNRENELRETIRKFEELVSKGFSKTQAAKTLGYIDHTVIWKKYQELERIETEKKSKQGANPKANFKESLKVENTEIAPNKIANHNKTSDTVVDMETEKAD